MSKPIAFALEEASKIKVTEPDIFLEQAQDNEPSEPKSRLALLFWGGISLLISFSFGLWVTSLIERLFATYPPLGWLALGVSILIALIALIFFIKEMLALRFLTKVSYLQQNPTSQGLLAVLKHNPKAARGLEAYHKSIEGMVLDERDRLALIEQNILKPLDEEAIKLISLAAKRVSVVTALSPKAIIDIVMVFITALSLMRRLAKLYGARAGNLAFLRLASQTLGHLTLTAGLALGDTLLSQLLGAGLAAKLSAKLGEGVVNGLLTARLGLAALSVTRPLKFTKEQPSLKAILNEIL
jgi:putative membrane protein